MSDLDPCQSAYLLGVRDGMKAAIAMTEGVRTISDAIQIDLHQTACLSVLDIAEMLGKEAIS